MSNPPEDNVPEPFAASGDGSGSSGAQQESASAEPQADAPAAYGMDRDAPPPAVPDENSVVQPNADLPLFYAFTQPPVRHPVRVPHMGHLLLLWLLIALAASILGLGLGVAGYFHLFGWKFSAASTSDLKFNLLSEAALYFITFVFSLVVFPRIWHEGYFAGLQWRAAAASSRFWFLAGTASACFILAILDQVILPGPSTAPIEKMFNSPGAAWLMFAFGVTVAPFFEEMFFRGFLLPALSTAADWIAEKVSAGNPMSFRIDGRVQWPPAAIATTWISLGSLPAACFLAFYWRGGHLAWQILLPYVVVMALFFTGLALRKSPSPELTRPIGPDAEPRWSYPSMAIAALVTSVAFAGLHLEQQGNSLGPFLLIVLVSLILCAVRLITRSLAASTLVHATYNFFIFTFLLIGTSGFRHLDRM